MKESLQIGCIRANLVFVSGKLFRAAKLFKLL